MASPSAGISGRVVFRAGIGLVLIGIALLLRYSLEQNWFGPEVRLAAGGILSASLIGVGLAVPRPLYGRLLQGGGVAGGYATVWAAHARYDLVDSTVALVQLLAVVAVGLGLAWRERSDSLNALGMLGAVSAPLVVGGDLGVGLLVYEAIFLIAGAYLLVIQRWKISWATVTVAVGAVLAVESVATPEHPLALFVVVVVMWWAVGWLLPNLGHLAGFDQPTELTTLGTLAVPAISWVVLFVTDDALGFPAALALAVSHVLTWVNGRAERSDAVLQLLMAYGFTVVVLADRLEPAWAVGVYLALTMAVAVFGALREDETSFILGHALAVPALGMWTLVVDQGGRFEWTDAARDLGPVLVMATASVLLPRRRAMAGVASYVMMLMWLGRYPGEIDTGWVTAGMAVMAIAALVAGRLQRSRLLVWGGGATLVVALAKLVFSDLATADPLLRIGLSLGIGVALLALGYWIGDSDLLAESDPAEHEG